MTHGTPRPPAPPLAAQLGLSQADLEAWQKTLDRRPPRAPGRKAIAASVLALVAVSVFWSARGVSAGCPDPNPPLPTKLTKFCPDAPAYAEDVNQNFAQLVAWLQNYTDTVGGPIPSKWIKTANLTPASFGGDQLADNSVQGANVKDGIIDGTHVIAASVTKTKLDTASTFALSENNPACDPATTHQINLPGTPVTCPAAACYSGAPCTGGKNHFYVCGTTICGATCDLGPPICTGTSVGAALK